MGKLSEQVAVLEQDSEVKANEIYQLKEAKREMKQGYDARGRDVTRLTVKVKAFEDSPLKSVVEEQAKQIAELHATKVKQRNRTLEAKNSELESLFQKERNSNTGSKLQQKIDSLQKDNDRMKTEAKSGADHLRKARDDANAAREEVGTIRAEKAQVERDLVNAKETVEGQRGRIDELGRGVNVGASPKAAAPEEVASEPRPEPTPDPDKPKAKKKKKAKKVLKKTTKAKIDG